MFKISSAIVVLIGTILCACAMQTKPVQPTPETTSSITNTLTVNSTSNTPTEEPTFTPTPYPTAAPFNTTLQYDAPVTRLANDPFIREFAIAMDIIKDPYAYVPILYGLSDKGDINQILQSQVDDRQVGDFLQVGSALFVGVNGNKLDEAKVANIPASYLMTYQFQSGHNVLFLNGGYYILASGIFDLFGNQIGEVGITFSSTYNLDPTIKKTALQVNE